jgi:hypothetical protein
MHHLLQNTLPTQCSCVFLTIVTEYSDYSPGQRYPVGLCNGQWMCFLCGKNRSFISLLSYIKYLIKICGLKTYSQTFFFLSKHSNRCFRNQITGFLRWRLVQWPTLNYKYLGQLRLFSSLSSNLYDFLVTKSTCTWSLLFVVCVNTLVRTL